MNKIPLESCSFSGNFANRPKSGPKSAIFCPILPSIFRQKPLHLVVNPLYFPSKPQFCIIITTSTFPVPGNMSTPQTFSTLYPLSCSTTKSLTKLVGLQDIYTIRSTPKSMIFPNAFGCIPSLGGSTTIKSGLS